MKANLLWQMQSKTIHNVQNYVTYRLPYRTIAHFIPDHTRCGKTETEVRPCKKLASTWDWVLIAFAQKPPLNSHADTSSGDGGL